MEKRCVQSKVYTHTHTHTHTHIKQVNDQDKFSVLLNNLWIHYLQVVDRKGSAAMLAAKRSAGVAPYVNLRNSLHPGHKVCKPGIHLTRTPKQGISGFTIRTYVLQIIFFKKSVLFLTILMSLRKETICDAESQLTKENDAASLEMLSVLDFMDLGKKRWKS